MRFQTPFEKFFLVANGNIFAACLVGLRFLLGIASLYAAISWLNLGPGAGEDVEALRRMFLIPVFIAGISMTVGLFVRPVAALTMVVAVFLSVGNFAGLSSFDEVFGALMRIIATLLILGMFVAGGSSHIFGLDGLIYSNLRRPNTLTKFLFG